MKTGLDIESVERVEAIDFTKGILVVFMFIYHSLNVYSIFPNRYMQFLTPSFIMITGFIITQIYFPKHWSDMTGGKIKLAVRSLKILLLFTFLNVVGRLILPIYNYGAAFELEDFFGDWIDIYLIGSPRTVAFDILLPISYTILISIFIPKLKSIKPYLIIFSAITIFSACLLMGYYKISIFTITMMSAGIIGMALGLIPLSLINIFARSWIKFAFLIVIYVICFFSGHNYITQIFSTILALLIIYSIGVKIDLEYFPLKQIILLGQYSLLGYIMQIAYLRIIFTLLSKWHVVKPNIMITIISITIMTYISILILDYARAKYKYINVLYKTVFA